MNKKEYIESLEEIVSGKILITNELNILKEEISENCWSISGKVETLIQLKIQDIRNVLERIKSNRNEQLNQSNYEIDLIYYSWYDEMANQIRFNFINSNHKVLPFNSKIRILKNEDEIIRDFLNTDFDFKEAGNINTDENQKAEKDEFELNVYKELIRKKKTRA